MDQTEQNIDQQAGAARPVPERTWLVHIETPHEKKKSQRQRRRLFRRPRAQQVRIGKEAQLFDYDGRKMGGAYGSLAPAAMGFLLPMCIVLAALIGLLSFATIGMVASSDASNAFSQYEMEDWASGWDNWSFDVENFDLSDLPPPVYAAVAVVYLLTFAVAFLFIRLCLRQAEKRKFATLGLRGRGRLPRFLLGWALAILAVLLPFVLAALFTRTPLQWNPNVGLHREWLLPNGLGLLFFCVQGSFEELIFRGWSLTTLGRFGRRLPAVLISSAVFASLHYALTLTSLLSVLNAFVLGCLFCLMTLWSGDIFLSCGFHAMWNYLQMCLVGGFVKEGGWLLRSPAVESMEKSTSMIWAIIGCMAAATVVVAVRYRKKIRRESGAALQPLPAAMHV